LHGKKDLICCDSDGTKNYSAVVRPLLSSAPISSAGWKSICCDSDGTKNCSIVVRPLLSSAPTSTSLSPVRTLSWCWAPVVLVPAAVALSTSGLKSGNSGERTGVSVGTLGLGAVGSRVLATARARSRARSRAVAGAGARSKAVPGTREGNAIATAAVGARWCVETGVALVDVPGDGDLLAVAVPDHMASSASRCLESGAVGFDCPPDEGGHGETAHDHSRDHTDDSSGVHALVLAGIDVPGVQSEVSGGRAHVGAGTCRSEVGRAGTGVVAAAVHCAEMHVRGAGVGGGGGCSGCDLINGLSDFARNVQSATGALVSWLRVGELMMMRS
jgi:hypothetical protein